MSRGLGRVQWGCLMAIWQYERKRQSKRMRLVEYPTTFDIAAEVYKPKPGQNGECLISDAQHVAVKRALAGLQRKGRVVGFRTDSERVMRWHNSPSRM